MTLHETEKVFRSITRERRLRESRVVGDEIFRRGIQVGEVASSTAGDPDFFPDARIVLQHDDGSSALSGLDGAHETGGTGADNNDV